MPTHRPYQWYVEMYGSVVYNKVTGDRNEPLLPYATILKLRSLLDETHILKTRLSPPPPPPTHSSSSSPQQQQFHLKTTTVDHTPHCRPHPSPWQRQDTRRTTQSIYSSVLVYTPSWWKTNASRSLNSTSHVHVPGCAHAEAQKKFQHAKAGFGFKQSAWVNVSVQRGVCKTAGEPTQ